MKNTIIIILSAMLLCSFGYNKPDHIQRRKGVMNVDANGKITFVPLEDWKDYVPKNDTTYQIRIDKN